MRFGEYLRDRRYPVLFWAAAAVVSEGVLLLFGSPAVLQIFLLAIWAAAGAGILAYDYGRKRSFYDGLRERLGQLDEKYLVIEMLREPRFLEGKILYRSLGEILKSMNDEIGCHERISNAFRTYVETWVHEIKIPIAGAKLIMHNNPGESSRKLKEQLGKVEAYVEQVLYYIRSEVPQNDYSIGKYSLRELAESAVRENRDSLIMNGFRVQMDVGDLEVRTDRKWLVFMLGQIISNTVKYAREGERMIRFAAETEEGREKLSVEDNGIGISAGDLPRVFEKSFTGKNGRAVSATGMGLYLCRKLCGELGHRITAESEEGKYTRITIEFG